MANAFTQREREEIERKLLLSAEKCAATIGMKHTTIEQLAADAGISKGAFYKFYASKELLFLAVLERLHTQMYGSAEQVLRQCAAMPPRERTLRALERVFDELRRHSMSTFLQRDLPTLLVRLPQEEIEAHYHSDTEHIQRIIELAHVRLRAPVATVSCVVNVLLTTLMEAGYFDSAEYPRAIQILLQGACEQLIDE